LSAPPPSQAARVVAQTAIVLTRRESEIFMMVVVPLDRSRVLLGEAGRLQVKRFLWRSF
jgi:hypothetical protein